LNIIILFVGSLDGGIVTITARRVIHQYETVSVDGKAKTKNMYQESNPGEDDILCY